MALATSLDSAPSLNVLSVDVEDYFQVEAMAAKVRREDWGSYPSRVVANTERLLDVFDAHGAKATCFILGWVAEKCPALIAKIKDRGHEIGCHSYWHRCIFRLTPQEFREDTRRAKDIIEQAAGTAVKGYRAPSWSITKDSLWALDILAEEGFTYDSSIYPIAHDTYGIPGAERFPYTHTLKSSELKEFPPATVKVAGVTLPVAGGGYLRMLPMAFNQWAAERILAENEAVSVYLHPWEIDPEQPRIHGIGWKSRLRHYTNLASMESRLVRLLEKYPFTSYAEAYSSHSKRATA